MIQMMSNTLSVHQPEQDRDGRHRPQKWERHAPEPLPANGSVQGRRLVQLGRNGLQTAVEHDQVERDSIQTFAMITDTSDQSGDVSQLTGSIPTYPNAVLTMPESLLSIHDHVDDDTISGNNHGTRNSARSVTESGKAREKKTARANPMVKWKNNDATVNTSVCEQRRAERRIGEHLR